MATSYAGQLRRSACMRLGGAGPRLCRPTHCKRRLPPPRGVQFTDQFMNILQGSLEREEARIAEKVGIPDLFIHESLDTDEADADGSGAIMWPAGIRLSRHLVQNRQDELRGARVLEIGSGTGIVGLSAACLGAHVMLTDRREGLPIIWENVEANGALIDAAGGSATVVELDWNDPDADPDVLDQDYDWIFGADVTYDPAIMPQLAKLLRQMVLTNPTAVIKLAHMHRSKDIDRAMREIFSDEGLLLRPVDVRTTATAQYDDPLRVDESIVFYRVVLDDNRRFLSNGNGAHEQEVEEQYAEPQQYEAQDVQQQYAESAPGYDSGSGGEEAGYWSEQSDDGGSSGSSDWQEVQDEEGRTYYYNHVTGVTQWERPDELA